VFLGGLGDASTNKQSMRGYPHAQLANIVRKQESFVFEKTALLYSVAKQVKTVYID